MKKQNLFRTQTVTLAIPALLLVITLFLGIFLVRFLEKVGNENLREQSENVIEAMARGVENELHFSSAAAETMAGAPSISSALLNAASEDLKDTNLILDRYRASFGFSVCYLLDARGRTIAASNRDAPDSFVGKDYSFRPYFTEALQRGASVYMGEGVTSRERGFYAAHAVNDPQGTRLGVVVIKKSVREAENVLAGTRNSFFVSPEGVIFMSGSPEKIFRIMAPLADEQLLKLKTSKQFTLSSMEPLFRAPVRDGGEVLFQKEVCRVFQKSVGLPGWSIVLLEPLHNVIQYTLLGGVITVFMGSIILLLWGWVLWRVKAQENFRASQERFRAAFESSGIGMALTRPDGRWLEANPTLCHIVGYTEEELQRKTFQEITHSDDLEANLAHVKHLLNGEIQHYSMEKRYFHQDGHIVWVFLTVSVVRDLQGVPLYFVSQVEDITGRKATEEELRKKIEELERFNKIAVSRELKMIELKEKIKALERGREDLP